MITKSHIFLTQNIKTLLGAAWITCSPRECPLSTETLESRPAPGCEGWDLTARGWLRCPLLKTQVSVSSDKFLPLMSGFRQVKPRLDGAKAIINFLPRQLSKTQKHNGYCSAFLFIQLWLLNCCWSPLSFLIRILFA